MMFGMHWMIVGMHWMQFGVHWITLDSTRAIVLANQQPILTFEVKRWKLKVECSEFRFFNRVNPCEYVAKYLKLKELQMK